MIREFKISWLRRIGFLLVTMVAVNIFFFAVSNGKMNLKFTLILNGLMLTIELYSLFFGKILIGITITDEAVETIFTSPFFKKRSVKIAREFLEFSFRETVGSRGSRYSELVLLENGKKVARLSEKNNGWKMSDVFEIIDELRDRKFKEQPYSVIE